MSDFTPTPEERAAQQARVLAALQHGPKTTQQLRETGIMHPAGRIMELRRQGHQIETFKTAGRVALYVLQASAHACLGAALVHVGYALAATAERALS